MPNCLGGLADVHDSDVMGVYKDITVIKSNLRKLKQFFPILCITEKRKVFVQCCLGVKILDILTWEAHINEVASKISKVVAILTRLKH